jgi:hypothetical protein
VEDEHGRLVGVVPRVTLLAALGGQALDTPDALQEEDHRG